MLKATVGEYTQQLSKAREFCQQLEKLEKSKAPMSGLELLKLEEEARALGNKLADLIVGEKLLEAHRRPEIVENGIRQAKRRSEQGLRGTGERPVEIRLSGGGKVDVFTPYMHRERRGSRGRRRKVGKRGKQGSGIYPVLKLLGIEHRSTPFLIREIGRQVVSCSSYDAARAQLERQGCAMNVKTIKKIAKKVGKELIELREQELIPGEAPLAGIELPLKGKRILVSTDGGRVKVRTPHKKGPKKANGRKGFSTAWREPRGILIQIMNDDGKIDRTFRPWLDMGIWSADETMDILGSYLLKLGASQARELVFTADGADWIWNRLGRLIEQVGIPKERVTKVADFYHGCEHLTKALEACKGIERKARKQLYKKLKGYLFEGEIDMLLSTLKELAKGRRAKKLKVEIAYFEHRREMMDYASFRKKKVPLGSGSMESAIRRVNNLRFKGPGIMWRLETVEALYHIRALVKSGRYEEAYVRLLRKDEPPCEQTRRETLAGNDEDNTLFKQGLQAE